MDCAHQIIQTERLQGGAQPPNMHVNRTHTHYGPLPPYFFQQTLARMHFVRMGHEEMQQSQFHRAQKYLHASRLDTVRNTGEMQAAQFD